MLRTLVEAGVNRTGTSITGTPIIPTLGKISSIRCLQQQQVKNPTMMAHADMPSTVEYSWILPTQRLCTSLLLPLRSGVSVDWAGLALHHHNTLSIGRQPCIVIRRYLSTCGDQTPIISTQNRQGCHSLA